MVDACVKAYVPGLLYAISSSSQHRAISAVSVAILPGMCDVVALAAAARAAVDGHEAAIDVVSLVQNIHLPRIFAQRSWEHIKHARTCRQTRQAKQMSLDLTGKASFKIEEHNCRLAKTAGDKIEVGKVAKPVKVGKGGNKRWLPAAVLRACFGEDGSSMLHQAPRTVAQWFRAGHGHVQRVRNAVAETILQRVTALMDSAAEKARNIILEVSFDETKEDIRVDGATGTHHVMIIHARLTTQVDSGEFADADIPLPTSVIDSTDAPHLLYTLQTRLPLMFRFDPGVRYALILNCDSAPSNSRLARHMIALAEKEPFVFLHSRCMMHMACATIVTLLKELDLTNSAFCATLQLHDGARMRSLRAAVRQHVLEILYVKPELFERRRLQHRQLVDLLLSKHNDPDDLRARPRTRHAGRLRRGPGRCVQHTAAKTHQAKRRKAAEVIVDMLHGDWEQPKLEHWCAPGCCEHPDDAVEKITTALDELLLCRRPQVPSLNRWTRLYQPLAWWCLACRLHNIIPACMIGIAPPAAPKNSVVSAFSAWQGPADEDMFRARNISALDFAVEHSLATRAMEKYSQLILTEGDPFWLVYNRGEWTTERYRMALHGCLALMGHILLRMVLPFQAWPWPLAELASQKTSQERRDAVADCFWAARPCCLDTHFSQPFKAMVKTRAGVTSEVSIKYLREVFKRCPLNNVQVETKFGRQRNFKVSCAGNLPDASTVASSHVLAELAAVHKRFLEREMERETASADGAKQDAPGPAPTTPLPAKRRRLSQWNVYVQSNAGRLQSKAVTMSELGHAFNAMTPDQKKAFAVDDKAHDPAQLAIVPAPEAIVPARRAPGEGAKRGLSLQTEMPLAMGCKRFPIAPDCLQQCCADIASHDKKWKTRAACACRGSAEILEPTAELRCQDIYGPDICFRHEDYTDDRCRRFHEANALLKNIAHDDCAKDQWSVPMYFVVEDGRATLWLIRAAVVLSPIFAVFIATTIERLDIDLGLGSPSAEGLLLQMSDDFSIVTNADVARTWLSASTAVQVAIYRLEWEFQTLNSFRIIAWRDATEELNNVHRKRQAPANQRSHDFVQKLLLRRPRGSGGQGHGRAQAGGRRGRARRSCFRRKMPASEKIADDAGSGDDMEMMALEDEEHDEDAALAASAASASPAASAAASAAPAAASAPAAHSEPLDVVFGLLGLPGDEAALWQEAEAHAEADAALPFYDFRTCQVHDGKDNKGAILGRIKPVRPGAKDEAISVYCRRHGCSKMLRPTQAPDQANLLAWFRDGKDIPDQHKPEYKAEHMNKWPKA